MKQFVKKIIFNSEFRVLIYASLILVFTSCIMQYPLYLTEFNKTNDAGSYRIASDWLYSSDHFASLTRPFLFPLLIGLPRLFGFEYSEYFVAALNFVFWLATINILFRLISDILDKKKVFQVAIIFASCVSLHCFLVLVHTEVLYCFILLSHIFCFYQYFKTQKEKWFYTGVWLLGASVVVRPTLTYFVFFLYGVLVMMFFFQKVSFKRIIIISLLLSTTIGFQIGNMYRCCHRFKISYIGDETWYQYVSAYAFNVAKYPNQTIDFYAKQWEKEATNRNYGHVLIGNNHTRNDVEKLDTIESCIKNDMRHQFSENILGLAFTFCRSIFVNSRSGTQYATHAVNGINLPFFNVVKKTFLTISQSQNSINSIFILFILPMIFIRHYKKERKPLDKMFALVIYTWFLEFLIIVFSTISFTQGDRFHVVTVPLTLFCVVWVLSKNIVLPHFFNQK